MTKTTLLVSALLSTLSVAAFAAVNLEGKFASPTTTFYLTEDQKACEENGGTFEGDMCVVAEEDILSVKKEEDGYAIDVSTWGSNGHSCNYQGKASLVDGKLVSVSKEDDGEGKTVDCTVTVTYTDENTVDVNEAGEGCRYYCGARGFGLGIGGAKRK